MRMRGALEGAAHVGARVRARVRAGSRQGVRGGAPTPCDADGNESGGGGSDGRVGGVAVM